jgi:ABC-type dipeptide/oligopeptide/nickel transport system permease component
MPMLRFLAIRILQAIPVLAVMSVITFAIIQAPPGDYGDFIRTNMMVQGNATAEAAGAAADAYREAHGLNDPMVMQYGRWIWGILSRGDFGQSFALQQAGAGCGDATPARHHRHRADLPHPGKRYRHQLWHHRGNPAVYMG